MQYDVREAAPLSRQRDNFITLHTLILSLFSSILLYIDNMISSGNDEEKGVTPSLTKSNSKHLSLHRHVSTVINTYIGDLESSDRIKFDPSSTSENDLEHLIDQVLESYKDENGNVLQREIIRDALLSNMEKFKQHAENSHLTKEVSNHHNSFPSLLY